MNLNNLKILECKRVRFYSSSDKNAFFEWINTAKYIKKFEGKGDKIILYVQNKRLTNPEALDLVALFRRYKITTKQLEMFFDQKRSLEDYKQHFSYCIYPRKDE